MGCFNLTAGFIILLLFLERSDLRITDYKNRDRERNTCLLILFFGSVSRVLADEELGYSRGTLWI